MSEGMEALEHQLGTAKKLDGVVRTMKALAAANMGQYENAVRSLEGYYQTVRLGLAACFGANSLPANGTGQWIENGSHPGTFEDAGRAPAGWILFGSDQGLVGRFNSLLLETVADTQRGQTPVPRIALSPAWIVGERLAMEIDGRGFSPQETYPAPISIGRITGLVNRLLLAIEQQRAIGHLREVFVCHNKPMGKTSFTPVTQRLLPLDEGLHEELAGIRWPTPLRPQVIGGVQTTGMALVREYLFVSLYKACAESLASENASRLAAMEHAEKNIRELSEDLLRTYDRLRQEAIDEELFDVIFGAEAIGKTRE